MTPPSAPQRAAHKWVVPTVIVAVAAIAIALILSTQGTDATNDSAPAATASGTPSTPPDTEAPVEDAPTEVGGADAPDLSEAERRDPADPLAIGPVDAPVALIVFSDYQCPYCAKWAADTLPVMEEYVDSGDLRIEFRDVNVFGEASVRGARAAYAAALQNELPAMHDALFADGQASAATQLTDERLLDVAADLGLDTDQFAADYASDETAAAVARNQQLGLDLGAFSTPSFILDGMPFVGAQPTEVFVDLMEKALASEQGGE